MESTVGDGPPACRLLLLNTGADRRLLALLLRLRTEAASLGMGRCDMSIDGADRLASGASSSRGGGGGNCTPLCRPTLALDRPLLPADLLEL